MKAKRRKLYIAKFKKVDIEFHNNMKKIINMNYSAEDYIHQFPIFIGHVNLSRYLFLYDRYLECKNISGHIADIGTWKGSSLLFMAKLIRLFENYSQTQVHGYDWFEGMKPDKNDEKKHSDKYAANYKTLVKTIKIQKLDDIAIIHKIDLTKDLPKYFNKNPYIRFKLAFVDCGIANVLEASLANFWPRIVNGGILIMDHYNVNLSPWESNIVDKYIGRNIVRSCPSVRQPTAYIIKEYE